MRRWAWSRACTLVTTRAATTAADRSGRQDRRRQPARALIVPSACDPGLTGEPAERGRRRVSDARDPEREAHHALHRKRRAPERHRNGLGAMAQTTCRASEADQEKMICHVGIELEGMNSMDTVDDGRFWGLLMEDGIQRAHETCIGDGFDSNQFLNQDPIEQYAGQNWEIQLGGDLEASTVTWLTDSYGDGDDFNIDHYWGATLVSDDYEPDFEDNFFRGWRMDPNTYDVGSTDYMTKYEYDIGGELATGLYLFDQNIYWNVGPVD